MNDLDEYIGHITSPPVHFVITPTVFFNDTSCMIGINELGIESDFAFDGRTIVASCGYEIEWPDDDTAQRVIDLYRKNPERVFVAEFGPHGAVAEHSIN